MAKPNFSQLQVYQLSEKLADAIWDTVSNWDRFFRKTVGAQIVRSADSIGANIAEGAGQGRFQDNRRYVRIARGSLNETQHWLRRAYQRKLLNEEQIKVLQPIIAELAPRLNAYLRSIGPTNEG